MGPNLVFFAWNRSVPGREHVSAEHFQDFVQYLTGLQEKGTIQSFDVVFLDPHGGDLNGFFLVRGETKKLDSLLSSTTWIKHIVRAEMHLDGCGVVRGRTGDAIPPMMELWTKTIPA